MDFFNSIQASRFLSLCKQIPKKHIDDAFHLWTAEENNLDAFLTMDNSFCKEVNQKQHLIRSKVLTCTPKMLCEYINIQPVDIEYIKKEFHPFR